MALRFCDEPLHVAVFYQETSPNTSGMPRDGPVPSSPASSH